LFWTHFEAKFRLDSTAVKKGFGAKFQRPQQKISAYFGLWSDVPLAI
jgi:hypothetical protein